MATDESQPSTPVREVASEGLSSVSPSVVSSPASSSMSPDISAFLQPFRQARPDNLEDIASQMIKKRKERDEAKIKAKAVAKDLKKMRSLKARTLKKTKLASAEELLEALADRAAAAEKKQAAQNVASVSDPPS